MTHYFIAPDAHNVPTLWRENGDLPQPVATRHQFRDDPEVWAALADMPRVIAEAEERGADLGRRATLDPGAFVKRGPDYEGNAYGERLDQWQARAIRAALGRKTERRDPYAWPTGCGHRLAGGALTCNRQDDHESGNCTYAATNGVHTKASEPTGDMA